MTQALLFLYSIFSFAANIPVVETVEGEKIIIIKDAKGKSRPGTIGSEVKFGEFIKTGPRSTVKVRYPDGSKLFISKSTIMEVKKASERSISELHKGKLRGLIKPRAKKARFIIRSKSAVMGVRGTDFVIASDASSKSSAIHAITGSVEVAETQALLEAGQGIPIGSGEKIKSNPGEIGTPEKFDRGSYLKDFATQNPEFQRMLLADHEAMQIMKSSREVDVGFDRMFNVLNFNFFISYIQPTNSGSGSLSPGIGYDPEINLFRLITLKAHIAAQFYQLEEGFKKFYLEAGPMLSKTFLRRWYVEAGPGIAVLTGVADPAPVGMLVLGRRAAIFSVFHKAFLQVTYYAATKPIDNPYLVFKMGFGMNI